MISSLEQMLKWFFSWNSFSCHVCFKTSKWSGGWDVWSQVVRCCRGSLLPNYGAANAFASCFALVCFMQGGKWKEMANDCRCTSFWENGSWIGRLHCQRSIWITTIIRFSLKVHKTSHMHALKSSKIESWSPSKAWGCQATFGLQKERAESRRSEISNILIYILAISWTIVQAVGIGGMKLRDFGGELPWYWWYWLFLFVLQNVGPVNLKTECASYLMPMSRKPRSLLSTRMVGLRQAELEGMKDNTTCSSPCSPKEMKSFLSSTRILLNIPDSDDSDLSHDFTIILLPPGHGATMEEGLLFGTGYQLPNACHFRPFSTLRPITCNYLQPCFHEHSVCVWSQNWNTSNGMQNQQPSCALQRYLAMAMSKQV